MNRIFSIESYQSLLDDFSRRRSILSFKQVENSKAKAQSHLILRHDIDADPKLALHMAQWECRKGHTASYFIQLHSPFYSVWDRDGLKVIREILSLGHEIGLHFDPEYYKMRAIDLSDGLKKDLNLLSELCGEKISRYSVHLPLRHMEVLNWDLPPGIEDAGSKKYLTDAYLYLSDSNGIMRENWKPHLDSKKNICLLIHPIWWLVKGNDWREKIRKLALEKGEKLKALAEQEITRQEKILHDRKSLDRKYKEKLGIEQDQK